MSVLSDVDINGTFELPLAVVLGTVVGLERALHGKSAGLRTHALVALGAAVFTLIGASVSGAANRDPTRIAAQVVSGIGFLGGGLIFVRQDVVRGLTTAASIWVAAAIGMACGAEQPILGLITTGLHFAVTFGLPPLVRRLDPAPRNFYVLQVTYRVGTGVLRGVLTTCTSLGWRVEQFTEHRSALEEKDTRVNISVSGISDPADLVESLLALPGPSSVSYQQPQD